MKFKHSTRSALQVVRFGVGRACLRQDWSCRSMRISIDVDIEPSEVPAATELLNVLRSLTEHIRVKQRNQDAPIANGHPPPPQNGVRSPQATPQVPANPGSFAPQSNGPPPDPDRQAALAQYIRGAIHDFGEVVRNLEKALGSAEPEVDKLFFAAFSDVVLDPKYINANADGPLHQEHLLYISLLGELQESIRSRIGQGLIGKMVRTMMDSKTEARSALILPAMVYAHLVQLNMTTVKGTLKMVEKFLNMPNGKAYGLTLLGKTAELCIDKVLQNASPVQLKTLTGQLDGLGEKYSYDVQYLNGFIKWQDPCFRVLTSRQPKHIIGISSMAYDPKEKQLVTASKDGTVYIWDEWGNVNFRHTLSSSYAFAMAVRPEHRDVILIAQPIAQNKGSTVSIAAIGLDQGPHRLKGIWSRPRTAVVTSLTLLPGHETFVVGEQMREGTGPKDLICVYDYNLLTQSQGEAQPTTAIVSQTGQVTCLSFFGASKQVVVAGTRHGQVALWSFARPDAPVKIFELPSSAGTPLCLDHDGASTFVCGTASKKLVQWDTQQMAAIGQHEPLPVKRSFQLDNYPVLKVLLWPNQQYGTQVAVITMHGCWIADLNGPEDQPPRTQHVQDVRDDDCSFTGAAWVGQYPYLFAGGTTAKVYMCQLVPAGAGDSINDR